MRSPDDHPGSGHYYPGCLCHPSHKLHRCSRCVGDRGLHNCAIHILRPLRQAGLRSTGAARPPDSLSLPGHRPSTAKSRCKVIADRWIIEKYETPSPKADLHDFLFDLHSDLVCLLLALIHSKQSALFFSVDIQRYEHCATGTIKRAD